MNGRREVIAELGWAALATALATGILLWTGGAGHIVFGGDLNGIFLQKFHAAVESLFVRGELPLWNPMEFNGHPLLGVMQGAVLYPPVWFCFGLFDDWTGLQLFHAIHYAWLALGMVRLLGRANISPACGAFAALIVLADPVDAGPDADHPTFLAAVSWFPWALYALDGAFEKPLRWLPLLAVAFAAQWYAGYPEFPIDSALLLGVVALATPSENRGVVARLAICAAGLALGAGLAGVQLMPALETMEASSRSIEEVRQVQAMTLAVGPMLPYLPVRFGWAVLAFGLVALAGPARQRWAWVLGAAFCIFALAYPLKLIYKVPPFEMVRFPIGWRLLVPVFVGCLAAAGLERFRIADNRAMRAVGGLLAAIAVATCLVIARGGDPFNPKPPPDPAVRAQRAEIMKSFAVGPYQHARFISPWDINAGSSLLHDLPTSWGYEPALNPARMRRGDEVGAARGRCDSGSLEPVLETGPTWPRCWGSGSSSCRGGSRETTNAPASRSWRSCPTTNNARERCWLPARPYHAPGSHTRSTGPGTTRTRSR